MKNVRSSKPCISMNFCAEFSKAKIFPCEYRLSITIFENTAFDHVTEVPTSWSHSSVFALEK